MIVASLAQASWPGGYVKRLVLYVLLVLITASYYFLSVRRWPAVVEVLAIPWFALLFWDFAPTSSDPYKPRPPKPVSKNTAEHAGPVPDRRINNPFRRK
jgi:hypothetical protein